MRRDWERLRALLLRLEQSDHNLSLKDFADQELMDVGYHMDLLMEAGLVEGKMLRLIKGGPHDFYFNRLTWAGHEFVDLIRDEVFWQQLGQRLSDANAGFNYEIIKAVATELSIRAATDTAR